MVVPGRQSVKEYCFLSEDKTYCVVCAWRDNCKKKFHFESSLQLRCPDYTRDLTIKKDPEEEDRDTCEKY